MRYPLLANDSHNTTNLGGGSSGAAVGEAAALWSEMTHRRLWLEMTSCERRREESEIIEAQWRKLILFFSPFCFEFVDK
ncbi:unnamed protein product [Trifolium pratense]|uniref:Uncharacterized protein n=1 Tax=Trifolium pratense TaxID=57577 RepID=A0ACB0KL91_TRIPR|nr:unnamed protein product [Trifolium pratense]